MNNLCYNQAVNKALPLRATNTSGVADNLTFSTGDCQQMNPTTAYPGFVYLISPRTSQLHKIGYTTNLEKRISQLQTGSATELNLVASWPGNQGLESAMHAKLAKYRTQGEWFRFPKIVLRELQLLNVLDPEAIRLPDYSNEAQSHPVLNIMVAARELVEISTEDTREIAEGIRAFAEEHAWTNEADVEIERFQKAVSALRLKGLRGREAKRFVRIDNSFKCLLHWKEVEIRWRVKFGMPTFRARINEAIAGAIEPAEKSK